MVQALKDIILELLLVAFLTIKYLTKVLNLVGETLLSHSEIIDNQSQILVNTIKVFELLSHLVCLFIEHLNFKLTWPNVSLKFLDLIVEHKLEFLKLLSFLLEINDSLIFVLNGCVTLLELTFLTLNLLLEITSALV